MNQRGMTNRTYLTVFAVLLLVVAIGVPALAGSGGDKTAKTAKKALKLAKKALKQDSTPGPRGPQGPQGPAGEDGSARAFATINFAAAAANGSVDAARSTVGATVTHPALGKYCVTFPGIDPASSAAVVSATNTTSSVSGATAEVLRLTPSCPDTTFEVLTKNESTGASGYAAASNFVGFTILVP